MFSLDGKPQENTGRTIGAALCYTGDYRLKINTDDGDYHHFFAGMDEEGASFRLKKGEVFRTPPLALTYSEEGLGGAAVISINGDGTINWPMETNFARYC